MTGRTIAARYAAALLEVTLKEGDIHAVESELAGFVDLMAGHQELHHALTSPGIPAHRKQAIVASLLERARVEPVLGRTLALLASRDRLALLPDLLAAYRERLLDREGVVRAQIRTAIPLPAARVRQIQDSLEKATGRRVTMETRVDESIIGGVVARVGGTVYDASLATQLRKVRGLLAGEGQ